MRTLLRLVAGLLVVSLGLSLSATSALAQAPTPVTGAADFRNPPMLTPGTFTDTIVTGETVWYAVIYRNDTPYRVEASLVGTDVASSSELDLELTLVSPTLNPIDIDSTVLDGPGESARGAHTDVWFVTVELATTGQVDVPHRLLLDVSGVESTTLSDCSGLAGCTFNDELAVLDAELAELKPALADALDQSTTETAEVEIASLKSFREAAAVQESDATARLAAAEAQLAELCAPEATCETIPSPGSKTPAWAMLFGLAALGWGGYRAFTRFNASGGEGDDVPQKKAKKPVQPVGYQPKALR